jgi:cyclic pyranopterin phosphate synthase
MDLVDPFGRKVTGLRIAVTPRCNLRCIYCHHEGETSHGKTISADTIVNVVNAGAKLGIRRIKFTGGEPLLRLDLEDILLQLDSNLDLSLTTNGIFLADRAASLADSGLSRVNISLDSIDPETYCSITGGGKEDLKRVILGIKTALDTGLSPIKLNMVVLEKNQQDVWDSIEFARRHGLILQLIELLDLKGLGVGGDLLQIERTLEDRSDRIHTRDMHRRRKYFLDGAEVEVVRPIDNTEFCRHCTRLRITSDGKIKPCLLRNDNLIEIGPNGEEEIKELLKMATAQREPYYMKRSGF